jgi:hypothetical protein
MRFTAHSAACGSSLSLVQYSSHMGPPTLRIVFRKETKGDFLQFLSHKAQYENRKLTELKYHVV